uniref:Uncharacterized protein n=1 Tax=Cyprinus carpio TaxID=7962 RepID=A0A8C1FU50_CYPCA
GLYFYFSCLVKDRNPTYYALLIPISLNTLCTSHKGVKCGWSHFKKPALAIFIGGLLFGTGTALSLLYFTQVGNVPYLVGPIFLSVGLMFLVTGLVWVPVIKQKMVHTAMTQMNHGRPLLPEQGVHTQSCVTIS